MSDEKLRRLRHILEGARRTAADDPSDEYLQGVCDGLDEAFALLAAQS